MLKDLSLFMRQMAGNPAHVGAIVPSGRALGRRMAAEIPPDCGQVVEIGPGTGAITREVLAAGLAAQNLTCLEMNPDFCTRLKARYPKVTILNEMAQNMPDLGLTGLGAVISGLPLLNMPVEVQHAIASSAFQALKPGAPLIQFTYGPKPPLAPEIRAELGLEWRKSQRIWFNLPPATVYVFHQPLRH